MTQVDDEFSKFNTRTMKISLNNFYNRFKVKAHNKFGDMYNSAIIESILTRIPLKTIYIHDNQEIEEVIHGKEIISAIDDFYNNKFKLKTTLIKHLGEVYYKDMPRAYQRRIDETYLDFVIVESWNNGYNMSKVFNLVDRINL